ncbi:hypothetical protein AM629_05790 [Photorhabdus heterorhabditis]|uniref:Uncharacterized protein n=1 Tax=Photorhabdus heterorhabditis TaxID=880156 RepID=A0ABR5KEY2_9GAMM|nr:hypothetical protein [Photorhabdus heterorhabditis]KOY62877.1 hypothetical protein AM629_05790 [Photorhabdus heterorhabditis]
MKFPFRCFLLATALSCSFPSIAISLDSLPLMPWSQNISVQKGRLDIDNTLKIEITSDEMPDAIFNDTATATRETAIRSQRTNA